MILHTHGPGTRRQYTGGYQTRCVRPGKGRIFLRIGSSLSRFAGHPGPHRYPNQLASKLGATS